MYASFRVSESVRHGPLFGHTDSASRATLGKIRLCYSILATGHGCLAQRMETFRQYRLHGFIYVWRYSDITNIDLLGGWLCNFFDLSLPYRLLLQPFNMRHKPCKIWIFTYAPSSLRHCEDSLDVCQKAPWWTRVHWINTACTPVASHESHLRWRILVETWNGLASHWDDWWCHPAAGEKTPRRLKGD